MMNSLCMFEFINLSWDFFGEWFYKFHQDRPKSLIFKKRQKKKDIKEVKCEKICYTNNNTKIMKILKDSLSQTYKQGRFGVQLYIRGCNLHTGPRSTKKVSPSREYLPKCGRENVSPLLTREREYQVFSTPTNFLVP